MRVALILATGAGFLAFVLAGWLVTGANPFVVWSWNLHHHARFYDEYPRTYWLWLWVNGIELAIAIGLPTIVWFFVGLLGPRNDPASSGRRSSCWCSWISRAATWARSPGSGCSSRRPC